MENSMEIRKKTENKPEINNKKKIESFKYRM